MVDRLATDPYSTSVFSTEDKDFHFLMEQEKAGKSKHEAILALSKKYGTVKCTKALIIDKGQDYVHTKLIFWYTNSKIPEKINNY